MQNPAEIKSIRRPILVSIIGFILVFVSISILYVAQTFRAESQEQALQNVQQWGQYFGNLALIEAESSRDIKQLSQQLQVNKSIQVIEIYRVLKTDDSLENIVYFDHLKTGYKPNSEALRVTKDNITSLLTPVHNGDMIKLLLPINNGQDVIGYSYIEMDSHSGLTFSNRLFIILIVLFFSLVLSTFVIYLKLVKVVTNPIRDISEDVLKVSKTKDFSLRIRQMPFREYDILSRNINSFLNRTERYVTQLGLAEQKSLELNIELEDKVSKRTEALKESNQELLATLEKLHQYQDQLVESEKMASLGDMVAGVAHEVNTPIGLGVTASTLLSDRMNEIKTSFDDKTLKSSQLKKFLTEGSENVGIIYRNLKRAAELISSFKKVAVDQSSEDYRQFNFSELLNEILLTLAPQIKNTQYEIHFDCPEALVVVSKPGPINQILINLILNSINHGFDENPNGSIWLKVSEFNGRVTLDYRDDGKGIAPAIKDKIFEPFTTTKRGAGGSGLGLHLVYNLVTQALGGSIQLDSEPGQGAKFEISFPVSDQLL